MSAGHLLSHATAQPLSRGWVLLLDSLRRHQARTVAIDGAAPLAAYPEDSGGVRSLLTGGAPATGDTTSLAEAVAAAVAAPPAWTPARPGHDPCPEGTQPWPMCANTLPLGELYTAAPYTRRLAVAIAEAVDATRPEAGAPSNADADASPGAAAEAATPQDGKTSPTAARRKHAAAIAKKGFKMPALPLLFAHVATPRLVAALPVLEPKGRGTGMHVCPRRWTPRVAFAVALRNHPAQLALFNPSMADSIVAEAEAELLSDRKRRASGVSFDHSVTEAMRNASMYSSPYVTATGERLGDPDERRRAAEANLVALEAGALAVGFPLGGVPVGDLDVARAAMAAFHDARFAAAAAADVDRVFLEARRAGAARWTTTLAAEWRLQQDLQLRTVFHPWRLRRSNGGTTAAAATEDGVVGDQVRRPGHDTISATFAPPAPPRLYVAEPKPLTAARRLLGCGPRAAGARMMDRNALREVAAAELAAMTPAERRLLDICTPVLDSADALVGSRLAPAAVGGDAGGDAAAHDEASPSERGKRTLELRRARGVLAALSGGSPVAEFALHRAADEDDPAPTPGQAAGAPVLFAFDGINPDAADGQDQPGCPPQSPTEQPPCAAMIPQPWSPTPLDLHRRRTLATAAALEREAAARGFVTPAPGGAPPAPAPPGLLKLAVMLEFDLAAAAAADGGANGSPTAANGSPDTVLTAAIHKVREAAAPLVFTRQTLGHSVDVLATASAHEDAPWW